MQMQCKSVPLFVACLLMIPVQLFAARTRKEVIDAKKPTVMIKTNDGNYSQTVFIRDALKRAQLEEEAPKILITKAEGIMRAAHDSNPVSPAQLSEFFADSVPLLERIYRQSHPKLKRSYAKYNVPKPRSVKKQEPKKKEKVIVVTQAPFKRKRTILSDSDSE